LAAIALFLVVGERRTVVNTGVDALKDDWTDPSITW
jgi:hypothetical protein